MHIEEFFSKLVKQNVNIPPKGYAPLVKGFEDFWIRRFYGRIADCYNRPITGRPGAEIEVLDRKQVGSGNNYVLTGTSRKCINLGSYNYLGFADENEMCRREVKDVLRSHGVSAASPYSGSGCTNVHRQLEKEIAAFVGKPAAIINPMGFATNACVIPGLVGKGDLIVSDALNHASIVQGSRSSGATIKVFGHNDPVALAQVLRTCIRNGQPRTGLPWKKIIVIVEGIYSMEGEICALKGIAEVCKKNKAYLWVDEAHSIGCLGKSGRGVCEQTGVSPNDVDVLMGTFTKSFGAVGGYIAGSQELIDWLRSRTAPTMHSSSMSAASVQQILSALKIIRGDDGTNLGQQKLKTIKDNANMFRNHLRRLGCHVLGDEDSPVIPLMLYHPVKITAFSKLCLERNIAVVVVGYPATGLLLSRVRFCISAAHTKEMLQRVLVELEEIIDLCGLQLNDDPVEHLLQFVTEWWRGTSESLTVPVKTL